MKLYIRFVFHMHPLKCNEEARLACFILEDQKRHDEILIKLAVTLTYTSSTVVCKHIVTDSSERKVILTSAFALFFIKIETSIVTQNVQVIKILSVIWQSYELHLCGLTNRILHLHHVQTPLKHE